MTIQHTKTKEELFEQGKRIDTAQSTAATAQSTAATAQSTAATAQSTATTAQSTATTAKTTADTNKYEFSNWELLMESELGKKIVYPTKESSVGLNTNNSIVQIRNSLNTKKYSNLAHSNITSLSLSAHLARVKDDVTKLPSVVPQVNVSLPVLLEPGGSYISLYESSPDSGVDIKLKDVEMMYATLQVAYKNADLDISDRNPNKPSVSPEFKITLSDGTVIVYKTDFVGNHPQGAQNQPYSTGENNLTKDSLIDIPFTVYSSPAGDNSLISLYTDSSKFSKSLYSGTDAYNFNNFALLSRTYNIPDDMLHQPFDLDAQFSNNFFHRRVLLNATSQDGNANTIWSSSTFKSTIQSHADKVVSSVRIMPSADNDIHVFSTGFKTTYSPFESVDHMTSGISDELDGGSSKIIYTADMQSSKSDSSGMSSSVLPYKGWVDNEGPLFDYYPLYSNNVTGSFNCAAPVYTSYSDLYKRNPHDVTGFKEKSVSTFITINPRDDVANTVTFTIGNDPLPGTDINIKVYVVGNTSSDDTTISDQILLESNTNLGNTYYVDGLEQIIDPNTGLAATKFQFSNTITIEYSNLVAGGVEVGFTNVISDVAASFFNASGIMKVRNDETNSNILVNLGLPAGRVPFMMDNMHPLYFYTDIESPPAHYVNVTDKITTNYTLPPGVTGNIFLNTTYGRNITEYNKRPLSAYYRTLDIPLSNVGGAGAVFNSSPLSNVVVGQISNVNVHKLSLGYTLTFAGEAIEVGSIINNFKNGNVMTYFSLYDYLWDSGVESAMGTSNVSSTATKDYANTITRLGFTHANLGFADSIAQDILARNLLKSTATAHWKLFGPDSIVPLFSNATTGPVCLPLGNYEDVITLLKEENDEELPLVPDTSSNVYKMIMDSSLIPVTWSNWFKVHYMDTIKHTTDLFKDNKYQPLKLWSPTSAEQPKRDDGITTADFQSISRYNYYNFALNAGG